MTNEVRIRASDHLVGPGDNYVIRIRSRSPSSVGWQDWRVSNNLDTIKRDLKELDTEYYDWRVIYAHIDVDWKILDIGLPLTSRR